jgi:hypothetical protein
MDIPRTAMDGLDNLYQSSVHQIRSATFDRYRALVADLDAISSVDAASRDRLHKAVLAEYLRGVARVKEEILNAARRIVDMRAKETSPFKEVRYNPFPLLRETDVL